jgi:CRISPR/Cas system-associated exonuclease Cas4 (RecB family)
MYFRILPILTALVLTTAPALVVQAASPKSEIQGTYSKIANAFARKDLNTATSYFTSDYAYTDKEGVNRSAADLRDYYAPLLRPVNVTSSKISIQSFNAQNSQIEAVVKQTSNMSLGANKIVYETTSRDTWVKTAVGWRIQQSQVLSVNQTVNGRPST